MCKELCRHIGTTNNVLPCFDVFRGIFTHLLDDTVDITAQRQDQGKWFPRRTAFSFDNVDDDLNALVRVPGLIVIEAWCKIQTVKLRSGKKCAKLTYLQDGLQQPQ